ncbi:MAG: cytochrome c biogenesis protein CcdA [Prochlorothrix sp.]|nr:cytochrome c biogenesis protein CcdA [Prochlorothrix sp.]
MLDTLQTRFYALEQLANQWVSLQLTQISVWSIGVLLLAGLMTSLTPCMLSMLPITLGYIGGYESDNRWQAAQQSAWFALGLATTLAGLGIGAAVLGRVYGQIGWGFSVAVSAVAIVMGLNLLDVLQFRLPNLGGVEQIPENWPPSLRSYGLGLTFGLVASPCSTPVLATILAWISASQDPLLGGVFLLAYAVGYVLPLVLAGTFVATLKGLLSLRRWSGWITPASGVALLVFGIFSLLSRVTTF